VRRVASLKRRISPLVIIGLLLASFSGCQGFIYKKTGQAVTTYSEDVMLASMLAGDDVDMACDTGVALSPLLLSFKSQAVEVEKLGILMSNLTGFCAQQRAWQHELQRLRALHGNDTIVAKDAAVAQQRALTVAAARQYKGFLQLARVFGPIGEQCPELETKERQFYFLVGLVNGLQATQSNISAMQPIDVPLALVKQIGRASQCLNDDQWWGVPTAINVLAASLTPNDIPLAESIAKLDSAMAQGDAQGVRLSHVLAAEFYLARSDKQQAKAIVTSFAQNSKRITSNAGSDQPYQLLDQMAYRHLLFIADRFWTEEAGFRTPVGQFGRFYKDKPALDEREPIDIDELI